MAGELNVHWAPLSNSEVARSEDDESSKMTLQERDRCAIEYSRSLLLEGDTLVSINYPGAEELYDPAGFKLSTKKHHVHSDKLLATGSTVFKKLLSDQAQERTLKRSGYSSANPLPAGIKYVINLTPPDEGDDAIDLITSLSCSRGIRCWAQTAAPFGVNPQLIDGRDEFIRPNPSAMEYGEVHNKSSQEARVENVEDIPEYCPIRHRTGIERLLRIIEGFDPKLNSAPKVLTLAVLGKYFDCKKVVAGFIESWIMTEPNNKILEVLPEASFQIGLCLESKLIVEPAFVILVSEVALHAAGRMNNGFMLGKNDRTILGRTKENINEDELNRIEAAANDFQSRVNATARKLTGTMNWFNELHEFRKLKNFGIPKDDNSNIEVCQMVFELIHLLTHYVRGRIMVIDVQPNSGEQNQYTGRRYDKYFSPYELDFEDIYETLSYGERYQTRLYWDMLREIKWTNNICSNLDFDPQLNQLTRQMLEQSLLDRDAIKVDVPDIYNAQERVNALILSHVYDGISSHGESETSNDASQPFFSFLQFLAEVQTYLASICRSMLEDKYFKRSIRVDILLCLGGEELKYLPLWAGGNEDGTGGVFEQTIPPAELGVAPNGPGPSFHTGLSTVSQDSSMVDVTEDDQMTEVGTVNTSVAVDNGLSGHIDRRAVISRASSTSSFVDVQNFRGKEKDKGVDHNSAYDHSGNHEVMGLDSASIDNDKDDFEFDDGEDDDDATLEYRGDDDDDFEI